MHGFDIIRRRVWDVDPQDCEEFEVLEGASVNIILTREERDCLHRFVLQNNTLTSAHYWYVHGSYPQYALLLVSRISFTEVPNSVV